MGRSTRQEVKQVVKESLEDKQVQKKVMVATNEAKDRKDRERNIVVRGWKSMAEKGIAEEDMKDPMKVASGLLGQVLKVKTEVGGAEWMRKEERKILLIKTKSWEDKKEILQTRAMLKGTMIFLEEDLTRKDREILAKLLAIRKEIKAKEDGK